MAQPSKETSQKTGSKMAAAGETSKIAPGSKSQKDAKVPSSKDAKIPPGSSSTAPVPAEGSAMQKEMKQPDVQGQSPGVADSENLKGKMTCTLLFAVLSIALGASFVFGYNIGVINNPGSLIKKWMILQHFPDEIYCTIESDGQECWDCVSEDTRVKIDSRYWNIVVGMFPIGAMIGGLSVGVVADLVGRKMAMIYNVATALIGGVVMCIAKYTNHFAVLCVGRLFIGLCAGLFSGLGPMYLTEISPVNYRGMLGSISQLSVTVSILFSNILGLPQLLGSENLWPFVLLFTIIPAIYLLITMPMCPESPKYLLIAKDQKDLAKAALVRLRGTENVEYEIQHMQDEADKAKKSEKVTICNLFTDDTLRWPLILCVALMLMQQLSGINVTMFYSSQIFQLFMSPANANYATLGVLFVNVLMTVVSTGIMDKAGRRTLILVSILGMWISTIGSTVFLHFSIDPDKGSTHVCKIDGTNSSQPYSSTTAGPKPPAWAGGLAITSVVVFVIAFATGAGGVPWFYVSECFQQNARGKATSIACFVNWFATSIIAFGFPPILAAAGVYSFLIFTGCLTFFFIFFLIYLPETKGKTIDKVLEEIKTGKVFLCRKD